MTGGLQRQIRVADFDKTRQFTFELNFIGDKCEIRRCPATAISAEERSERKLITNDCADWLKRI
jgi:hypothetical protein